ncbi:MAG: formylglycine-generating enzyme family protein [Chitinophagales bacterium]
MILVKGGSFTMGCTSEQGTECQIINEEPAHKVYLHDFYIGKYEVTNVEYVDFLNAKGNQTEQGEAWLNINSVRCKIVKQDSHFVVKSGYEKHPVIEVNWYGANAYAKWKGMRLPTEAEWEYAARGGTNMQSTKYAGSNKIDEVAWYQETTSHSGIKDTKVVGTKKPNELEIYDMTGNVWEWCEDWYDIDYYNKSPKNNPINKTENKGRIIRGGSWINKAYSCTLSDRFRNKPLKSGGSIGFRIASSL